jgi:hypothetical protein
MSSAASLSSLSGRVKARASSSVTTIASRRAAPPEIRILDTSCEVAEAPALFGSVASTIHLANRLPPRGTAAVR